jgi:hypothetical protein
VVSVDEEEQEKVDIGEDKGHFRQRHRRSRKQSCSWDNAEGMVDEYGKVNDSELDLL